MRLGLPVAVLIYYASAALGFEYTPDSSFFSLFSARALATGTGLQVPSAWITAGYPNPLWTFLVAAGHIFRLDYLLTAKVLSLLFGSFAIVVSYLVAFEVLRDNLQAFLSAIVIGLQSWLVQAAPSGCALPAALTLVLAAVFFLLRNEYLLAAIFAGLSTLIAWEMAGLVILIWLDISFNTKEPSQARRIKWGVLPVYAALVLPWILGSIYAGGLLFPELVPVEKTFAVTSFEVTEYALLAVFTAAGIVLLSLTGTAGKELLRAHLPLLVWMIGMAWLGYGESNGIFFLVLPLFVIYAFLGLQQIVARFFPEEWRYTLSIAIAGALLLVSQLTFTMVIKPQMANSVEEARDLTAIAHWLRADAPGEATVSAEAGGLLEYYSERRILPPPVLLPAPADLIVAVDPPEEGYRIAYDPRESGAIPVPDHGRRLVVWMRESDQ